MSKKYIEDVQEETEISERNIKYWSQKYDLSVKKDGRRNVFSERTITLLRLIKLLSDTDLFTHKFIRLQIKRALDGLDSDSENYTAYQKVISEGEKLLAQIDSAQGTKILPGLAERQKKSTKSTKSTSFSRKSTGSKPSPTVDIDEELL